MSMKGAAENLSRIGEAEIIVGIPSLNEAETIGNVAATADLGLQSYFPHRSSVIINADNHSPDGTREAFLKTPTHSPKIYISTPEGDRGKGRNVRNLFLAAVELRAKVVIIVDADLTSFTPQWIRNLGEPLLQGFDFVSPIYERHKYDASITNHFACPLLRALYGIRLRQPIGGDFGFSGKLAKAYLSERCWTESVAQFGIDMWMTTLAFVRGFRACETFLGSSKSHRVKDPARQLSRMFQHVVSTIFDLMIEFEYLWKEVRGSRPSCVFGYGLGVRETPPVPSVDSDHLYETFLKGFDAYGEIWSEVIPSAEWAEIKALGTCPKKDFSYPSVLWVRLLYSFAVAYRSQKVPRHRLVESMIPFYYSRMLSYINKTGEMGTRECEEYLENIFRIYEKEKDYLIRRWDEDRRGALLLPP